MSKALGTLMALAAIGLSDPAFRGPEYRVRDFKVKGELPKEKISKRVKRRNRQEKKDE